MLRFALAILTTLALAAPSQAQQASQGPAASKPEPPPYRISGVVFGDYYSFPRHHLEKWDGQHGLWLTRVYFTYDHTFTPKLTTRLRFEMNSNGKLQGGRLEPYIKDAYVRWTFAGRQQLTAGIQPSLTWDFVENGWGLRHVERTPVDFYRLDSSRETGFTVSGPLNASRTLRYAVQYGNDAGHSAETDRDKGVRLSARYETDPGLSLEVMLGRSDRPNGADRTLTQVFGVFRGERGRAGAQYTRQTRRAPAGSAARDLDLDLFSGFGVLDLQPDKTSAFVRVDRFNDPCPDCAGIDYFPIDPRQPFTMTLAGLDYALHPAVRISPNIGWVKYAARAGSTPAPDDDLAARLTFYWAW